jgi:hypothetical protein
VTGCAGAGVGQFCPPGMGLVAGEAGKWPLVSASVVQCKVGACVL